MNSKRFEYYHKDIGYLKKDIVFRTVFSVLFLIVFVWQIAAIINASLNKNLTTMPAIVSTIVLITSILLCLVSLSYIFKNFRIISVIKRNGKCISSVMMLIKTKKKSFLWLYNILIQALTLITSLVLIACLTYSILEIAYLSSISFYMPILILICVSGYNSIYHIKDEMFKQKTLREQQPLY